MQAVRKAVGTTNAGSPEGSRNHTCRQSGRQSEPHMQAVRNHTCRQSGTTYAGSPETHMQAARKHTCRQSGTTHAGSPEAHMQAVRNHTCRQSGTTHAGSQEYMQAVRNHTCRQSGRQSEPQMQAASLCPSLYPSSLHVLLLFGVFRWSLHAFGKNIDATKKTVKAVRTTHAVADQPCSLSELLAPGGRAAPP